MQTPKLLGIALVVALAIYFPVYISVTQLYGIPSWWALPTFPLSSIPTTGKFAIHANPDSPSSLGQMIVVSVTNTTTYPVTNATVNIIFGGMTVYSPRTNQTGQVTFQYPGEPTILRVEKDGYDTGFAVIPHAPAQWVREQTTAYIVGFGSSAFGALLSILGTFLITKKRRIRKTPGKTQRTRRSKKLPAQE